jgi:DNA-binding NtrC family response regulator
MSAPEGALLLVVDDDENNRYVLTRQLARAGYGNVATAADGPEALEMLHARRFDLVLLDVVMPGMDGFAVCERMKADAATRDLPVIFLTALDGTPDKVHAFAAGAVDYLTKPFRAEELVARVGTHLALRQATRALEEQNARLREEIEAHHRSKATIQCLVEEMRPGAESGEILGASPAVKSLLEQIGLVAATDSTVLILGETGTGKELVARAIHDRSARRERPLVKVNCAALPRELVESELFGHEKGAFTGATQQRRGRFELADGGTLLLDEVGELPLEAQAKLLRVLQEHEFERVGGTRSLRADVRVVAATNRDLARQVDAGAFRSDLYYRLNVFPLALPPLRERREDIPGLIRHFVGRAARKLGKPLEGPSPAFLARAAAYDWPGNVRELENVVERAAILARSALLEPDGSFPVRAGAGPEPRPPARHDNARLQAVERDHILGVLEETHWVIEGEKGAARVLGLNPSTLRARLHKLGIQRR